MSFIMHTVKACIVNVWTLIRVWCVASGSAEMAVAGFRAEEGACMHFTEWPESRATPKQEVTWARFVTGVVNAGATGSCTCSEIWAQKVKQDRGPAMLKCPRASWLSPGNQNYERILFHRLENYLGSFWVKLTEIYICKKTFEIQTPPVAPSWYSASLSTEAPVSVIYIWIYWLSSTVEISCRQTNIMFTLSVSHQVLFVFWKPYTHVAITPSVF